MAQLKQIMFAENIVKARNVDLLFKIKKADHFSQLQEKPFIMLLVVA